MPGKKITDHQVLKYKQHRNQFGQVAAAAKAGISECSARRIDDASNLPSQHPDRHYQSRCTTYRRYECSFSAQQGRASKQPYKR